MVAKDDFVDRVWYTLFTPVYWIYCLWPSFIRAWIRQIPTELFWTTAQAIWVGLFWSYIFYTASSYVAVPPIVGHYWNITTTLPQLITEVAGNTYTSVRTNPFGFVVMSYGMILSIVGFIKNRLRAMITSPTLPDCSFNKWNPTAFTGERAMKGSEFVPVKVLPNFMCFIYGVSPDGEKTFLGMGSRVENAILTAYHVVTGYDQLEIVANGGTYLIENCDTDYVFGFAYEDVCFIRLDARTFSMLGMIKATLADHSLTAGSPVFVQAYGPGNPAVFSMGTVVPANNGMGKIVYSGSTAHGFSGTPYVVNKSIMGMHLGYGIVNLGVDAAYIRMLLSYVPEDTPDWLMDELSKDYLNKREVRWEHDPSDPDRVIIHKNKRFFPLEKDLFFSVHRTQGYVTSCNDVLEKLPAFQYNDTKNEYLAPTPESVDVGANGPIVENEYSAQPEPCAHVSPTLKPTTGMGGMTLGTGAPLQMPAPPNDPSDYMSKTTFYELEKKKRRPARANRQKGFTRPANSTKPGSPGLEMIR